MKKVLVVDDSKTIRTICEWIYKGLEDHLLTADSAQSAEQIMNSESPDVVIVDYTLPDVDSYQFVSSIKDKAHVVMMGGSYAPFSAEKAKASGAVAVLMKPFKTQVFFDTVEEAFNAVPEPVAEPQPVSSVSAAVPASDVSPAVSNSGVTNTISGVTNTVSSSGLRSAPVSSSNSGLRSAPSAMSSGSGLHLAEPTDDPMRSSSGLRAAPTSGIQRTVRPIESKAGGGVAPFGSRPANAPAAQPASAKRFNFPGTSSQQAEQPVVSKPAEIKSPDSATPKTPVPSISPVMTDPETPQIDQAVLRAEVIAAVKSMLPAIVNSYLKKLIQAEVKPQLQNWVDTRVEALVRKMMQQ